MLKMDNLLISLNLTLSVFFFRIFIKIEKKLYDIRRIDTSSQVSQSTNRTCITHELALRRLWFNSSTWFDLGGKKKHGGLSCSKKPSRGIPLK